MAFTLDNFVRSILAVDAAIGDTSLVVALAAPPLRDPPAASAGAPGILILQDQPTAPTKIEIVTYTGVSIVGTQVTLTGVTRGLEGTAAQAWTAGTQTFSGTTAAALAQFALKSALAAVATSGNYNDLSGKPTLGTAAAQNTSDFASSAQGEKADNALPATGGTATGTVAFKTADDGAAHTAVTFGTSDPKKQLSLIVNNGEMLWNYAGWYGAGVMRWQYSGVNKMTLDNAGNLTTAGAIAGTNLSGTNTGDQDLSGYMPLTGGSLTGQLTIATAGNDSPDYAITSSASGGSSWHLDLLAGTFRLYGNKNGGGTTVPLTIDMGTSAASFAGTITAPNIGAAAAGTSRIYVQSADPGAVPDGSLWVW